MSQIGAFNSRIFSRPAMLLLCRWLLSALFKGIRALRGKCRRAEQKHVSLPVTGPPSICAHLHVHP